LKKIVPLTTAFYRRPHNLLPAVPGDYPEEFSMNISKLLDSVNTSLRPIVKGIITGDYLTPILDSYPLRNNMNMIRKSIAFTNCNLFDGIRPELQKDMIILVDGDKISDVCHGKQIKVPADYHVINADGYTIMPGLIDNHIHQCSPFIYQVNMSSVRQIPMQIALNNMRTVYSGVTTVCDMGGPQGFIKEFTKLADENRIPGPRYLNCFTLISPLKGKKLGYPSQIKIYNPFDAWLLEGQVATRPKTLAELKNVCYKVKENGGTHLKATFQSQPFSKKKYETQDDFPVLDDDWMKVILSIGKETGLVVDIHSPYGADAEKCVDLAIEVGARIRIQHMTFDRDLKSTFIQKMHDYGFYIIPTVMIYGDAFHMPDFINWLDKNPKEFMMPEANRQSKSSILHGINLEANSGKIVMEHDFSYFRDNFDFVRRNTQQAHDAGIIGFGTDVGGTNTGFFGRICSEIKHYVEFGIPFFDILKYLTSVNAGINGLDDRGVIKPGKLADLILVEGNPLIDPVSVLSEVSTVMKGGIFLKYKGIELALF
jgi:imidazolonepropionase-like amidohydrolase